MPSYLCSLPLPLFMVRVPDRSASSSPDSCTLRLNSNLSSG